MSDLTDWFAMGGYGGYIWPAYGLAALLLIGNLVSAWRHRRAIERRLRETPPPTVRSRP